MKDLQHAGRVMPYAGEEPPVPAGRREFEKIVVVTKQTALEELILRFNTREQARFYIRQLGESFEEYEQAHEVYQNAQAQLRGALPRGVRVQFLERGLVPTYSFGNEDLVVTLGPDGLVVNVAKYLRRQPLLAFNPDQSRIDGVLVPFPIECASFALVRAVRGELAVRAVTMAEAQLNDGQRLLAVNDLFIGAATHVSARYRLRWQKQVEVQSSSGLIVSTGAGSTGWHRSIVTGATRLTASLCGYNLEKAAPSDKEESLYRFAPEAKRLIFSVREPFESRTSSARLLYGELQERQSLEISSLMPQNGVIFSDGVESDYLAFNSGAVASIGVAPETLSLLVAD